MPLITCMYVWQRKRERMERQPYFQQETESEREQERVNERAITTVGAVG